MSARIDPRTLEKVKAFAGRRRRLILERGLCAFAVSLILIMTGLALLDRFLILPDPLRWILSIVGYAGVLVVLWRTCVRFFVHRTDTRELARMIEHADPSLREDLVSAIELGEQKGADGGRWDSERFRELLQEDVARRIAGVEVDALLPRKLVSPWLRGTGAALVLLVVLLLVPGLHFPKLLGRALLPGANLDRPSDIVVTFLEPAPADRIVASGDTVDLVVGIEGGNVDKVVLETREADGEREITRLTRREGNRYTGDITVNRLDVRYRVRARGTITRFHTLESRARPEVLEFAKIYHFPAYSGLPDRTLREDHGDLSALEGSTVDLEIKVNQKIARAELRLSSTLRKIEDKVIPLAASEDGLLRGRLELGSDYQTYRVDLEAAESGFTNKFSPDYELRAVPDLVPAVRLTAPETNREVAVNARVPIVGGATDDVGLARFLHAWRIDQGEWQERMLAEATGLEAEVAGDWNLRDLPLKAGETLFTRLIAVDSKGNRGESTIVRLAVTAEDTDTEKREWAEKETTFARQAVELARKLGEMAQAVAEARKTVMENREPELGVDGQQKIARAQAAVAEARHQATQVWEELRALEAEAPGPAEAADLEAAAEAIAEMRNRKLERIDARIADWATTPADAFSREDEMAEAMAWDARGQAERLAEFERALAAEDQAEVLATDLGRGADRQREVARAAADEGLEAMRDQQEIGGEQSRALEEALEALAGVTDGREQESARHMAAEAARERGELEQALAAETPDRNHLRQQADEARNRAEQNARQVQNMRGNLAARADRAREEMARHQPDPPRDLESLLARTNELASRRDEGARETDTARAQRLADEGAAIEDEIADGLEDTADQWRDLADFAQGASTPDRTRAADLEHAAQAADALAARLDDASTPEAANQFAEALDALRAAVETVEAGARTEALAEALRELGQDERGAVEENPEAGQMVVAAMRDLPRQLQRVEAAHDTAERARQAANSAQANQFEGEMREREQAGLRGDDGRQPQSVADQATALEDEMRGVADAIAPQVAAARETLENMAPGIPEQLRQLAEATRAQAEQSDSLAGSAVNSATEADGPMAPDGVAAEAQAMVSQSEETGERIDEIAGALAAEAGTEDLVSAESRERARDADDAIAGLDAAAPEAAAAAENLAAAASSASPSEQSTALQAAAGQQRALAETLGDLADRLESIESGGENADDARIALRGSEAETGVQEALDQAYGQARELADLLDRAESSPQDALAALERELERNPPMRQALDAIARESVAAAAQALEDATATEGQLGEALEQVMGDQGQQPGDPGRMQAAAAQQGAIGEQVSGAGEDLSRAGRHEARLGNDALGQTLAETGEATEAVAQGEAADAGQALAENQSQAAAAQSVDAAESAIREQADAAAELAGNNAESGEGAIASAGAEGSPPVAESGQPSPQSGSPAQGNSGSPAPPGGQSLDPDQDGEIGPFDPGNSQQGGFLAEALDALDQAVHSGALPESAAQPSSPQQGEQGAQGQPAGSRSPEGQAAQAQGQAQAALAAATASQARAMAQARAQGMTPGGRSPSPASMAAATQGGNPQGQGMAVVAVSRPGSVASVEGTDGPVPPAQDWSKLPPKVAKDLLEGQRQEMAPEYRSAIENYYRAIAEKAGRKNQP